MSKDLYHISKNLIIGEDYRVAQNEAIEIKFLEEAISFFKEIIDAKYADQNIDEDWYKANFLNYSEGNGKRKVALSAGLNVKTINNTMGSVAKEVVLDFANEHYEVLQDTINSLVNGTEFDVALKLSFKDITVNLDSEESLIVINALTVLRSNIRGGYHSYVGKGIEGPFMDIITKLLDIPEDNYFFKDDEDSPESIRETDFFFVTDSEDILPVEIKLMGRGNPESADGAIARDVNIFFYHLSDNNKEILSDKGIDYIEMCNGETLTQLYDILDKYSIGYDEFSGDDTELIEAIDNIIEEVDELQLN